MSRHPPPTRYELHPQLAADTHPLGTLGLCELRLMDDANYPWLVLVPRVAARPYPPEMLVERVRQLRSLLPR